MNASQVSSLLESSAPGAGVYLVGIGGCGMSGLGHLLLDLGYKISGSDLAMNEEAEQLRSRGGQIFVGHDGAQVRSAPPALVIYSSAIRPDNPELLAAQEMGIPLARRGVVLAALARRQRGLCVAGMHGKTTTTALLAFALEQLQLKPSYAIGAVTSQLSPHARLVPNAEAFFIAEVDESDGTLREFQPEHAIVLNVDEEHLDYYSGLDSICLEFQQFALQTTGQLVFCADDPRLVKLFTGRPRAVSYGFDQGADYRVELKRDTGKSAEQKFQLTSEFQIWHQGQSLGEFSIRLVGAQNISNAAAVVALLHELRIEPAKIAESIRDFHGAQRRQQELYRDEHCRIFDDYGHHPTEIRATLKALRSLSPRRLLVAFQPHRYSRTQQLLQQFATCFQDADRLWLTEIYAASEPRIEGITGQTLADAIRAQGKAVEYVSSLAALPASVQAAVQPGDLVLFIGAGDITKAAHALADQLRRDAAGTSEKIWASLSARLAPATVVRRDELLAKRTTLRVGGRADFYVEPASEAELATVLRFCQEESLPFLILGRGSNLLVQDRGIRGVVICLAHPQFSRLEVRGDELHCGAGTKLKAVAVEAKRNGLTGLEFLEGIPGSVGGALRMNAGAMGGWMFKAVQSVRFMDFSGQVHECPAGEVSVEYRNCPFFKAHIALGAVLKGEPAPREIIAEKMNACSKKRWGSQPAAPSAGCIFKNPNTVSAGRLIEELGLKGMRVGGAVISTVHGNFIVNEGNATARDVLTLIEIVKARAKTARGIELETEVEIVGENG
jgi:UDP-N-acetylmuramate--alanine ligase